VVIEVLVELSAFNIDKTFYYLVREDLQDKVKVGLRVLVPFSSQILEGFILGIKDDTSDLETDNLKEIIDIIDEDIILNDELLELGKYISKTTISTLISAYQAMLPKALKAKKKNNVGIKYVTYVKIKDLGNNIFNDKQQEIINILTEKEQLPYQELKKINNSVDTLLKKDILEKVMIEKYRLESKMLSKEDKKVLTEDQKKVSEEIIDNLDKYQKYLLFGVTGSGKTEVYMEVIEKVINQGKQAILIVPEITLASQIVNRFCKRFDRVAILHSGLSDGERYDEYRRIRNGMVDIVIGARSAIFAPLDNIGVIIIDECHTDSLKQDVMPKYDSIDIGIYRAAYHHCPLVLGSATPQLELFARAQKGLFKLLVLSKRVGKSLLPKVILCDMTKEERIKNTFFSKTLFDEINKTISLNEQVILLINKRGYSSSLTCKNCGFTMKCPHCDIGLTYHKTKDILRCHYCGYATNKPINCPTCHTDNLKELGSGTEKIEEELRELFKNAKIVRMDSDTTTRKGSHEKIINDFSEHKYDILLGTQMIAKGLDFSNVTLVGVITADTSLFVPSYKSSENTFQLLNQVSGRSGRGIKPGKVIIQTYNIDHYAINYAANNNYLGFYQEEMKNRLAGCYPPYFYLTYIIVKSKDYVLLSGESNKIANVLRTKLSSSTILGPSVCIPFKINDIMRFGILIKYKKEDNLYDVLRELIDHYKTNNKIKIEISFNPNNI